MADDKKKIHLLLVDDDPKMLQLFGGQFARKGFEVLYAHNGAEGWEMARRLSPDLILLDEIMPSMDGMETAEHLKAEKAETKDIPIVMLTSEDFSPDAIKALKEIGISCYIHKGLPFPQILEKVKEVLKDLNISYEEPESDF